MTKQIHMTAARYHYGILRTISVNHDYTIIIHPENWIKIIRECAMPECAMRTQFEDEQGSTWIVKLEFNASPGETDDLGNLEEDGLWFVFYSEDRQESVTIGINNFLQVLDIEDDRAREDANPWAKE